MDQSGETARLMGTLIDLIILAPLLFGGAIAALVVGKVVFAIATRPKAVHKPNFFTSTPEGNSARAEIMQADARPRRR